MAKSLSPSEYKILSFKIAVYMTGLLLTFLVLGLLILKIFGLSIPSVQVGGGLVLMFMGWKMLNDDDSSSSEKNEAANSVSKDLKGKEFYPLTFPITSGPGSISVILTISAHSTNSHMNVMMLNYIAAAIGVAVMGVAVYFCYIYLPRLTSKLSHSGLLALSKLLAFVILCIGVEIVWNGIHAFIWK